MKKNMVILAALCVGAFSAHGQSQKPAANGKGTPVAQTKPAPAPPKKADDDLDFDKSFEEAGTNAEDVTEIGISPKYYKPGDLAPTQPIALTTAKEEAINLARAKPTQLHKDCLNILYTVDPIYSGGSISGAVKGTIVIKWEPLKKKWVFDYLKYQLINIDQPACVFSYEAK